MQAHEKMTGIWVAKLRTLFYIAIQISQRAGNGGDDAPFVRAFQDEQIFRWCCLGHVLSGLPHAGSFLLTVFSGLMSKDQPITRF